MDDLYETGVPDDELELAEELAELMADTVFEAAPLAELDALQDDTAALYANGLDS